VDLLVLDAHICSVFPQELILWPLPVAITSLKPMG